MLWLIASQISATAYKFLPPGVRFDSINSFNLEMEPTTLGGADFTRYSKKFFPAVLDRMPVVFCFCFFQLIGPQRFIKTREYTVYNAPPEEL